MYVFFPDDIGVPGSYLVKKIVDAMRVGRLDLWGELDLDLNVGSGKESIANPIMHNIKPRCPE